VSLPPPPSAGAEPTVEVWIDVVCPWAYLGLDRSDLLRGLGFSVRSRTYELHPEIPPGGLGVRPDGRLAATYERVRAECVAVGMPFRAPSRVSSSRRVLEWIEAIAATRPEHHEAAVRSLFAARFIDDVDLGDSDAITTILGSLDPDLAEVREAVENGTGARRLAESIAEARAEGIVATPAWRFPGGFVVPGVHSRDQFRRWAGRLMERTPRPSEPGSDGR
jgi:predicted DsbA family dithiol-disulfide isomerase